MAATKAYTSATEGSGEMADTDSMNLTHGANDTDCANEGQDGTKQRESRPRIGLPHALMTHDTAPDISEVANAGRRCIETSQLDICT